MHKSIKKWRACFYLSVIPLTGITANPAQAIVITNGCASPVSCTLGELFGGGSITVDDKLFDDWSVEFLLSSGAVPDFGQVLVNGLDDIPLNPGIAFDGGGQLSVADTDFIELSFSFVVSTIDGIARIKDNELILSDTTFGPPGSGGLISIDELIFNPADNLIGDKHVEQDNLFDTQILSDSAQFAPQSSIFIEKDLTIQGDFVGNVAGLNRFEQRFSQIPAPTPLLLFAAGGIAWLCSARRPPPLTGLP